MLCPAHFLGNRPSIRDARPPPPVMWSAAACSRFLPAKLAAPADRIPGLVHATDVKGRSLNLGRGSRSIFALVHELARPAARPRVVRQKKVNSIARRRMVVRHQHV